MSLSFSELLRQPDLVMGTTPSVEDIENAIRDRIGRGYTLQAMYGETYDRLGHTLESLKYYFYVAAIGQTLRTQGIMAESTILVADVATCHNEPEDNHSELMYLGKERRNFIENINRIYNLGLKVLLMSEYLYSADFQRQLQYIREKASTIPNLYRWVEQTVPPSKVDMETEKGFAYAFDEITTIIGYDIKVGPPREKFYDEPARYIGRALGLSSLLSIYLHPTYPLGLGRSFFFKNQEIEQYGVTAYKAGSKNLESHRIIIGKTSLDEIVSLVNQSVVSKKTTIPNAVLDLVVIAEMAKQWLESDLCPISIRDQFYNGELSSENLQHMAIVNLDKYILQPLSFLYKTERS